VILRWLRAHKTACFKQNSRLTDSEASKSSSGQAVGQQAMTWASPKNRGCAHNQLKSAEIFKHQSEWAILDQKQISLKNKLDAEQVDIQASLCFQIAITKAEDRRSGRENGHARSVAPWSLDIARPVPAIRTVFKGSPPELYPSWCANRWQQTWDIGCTVLVHEKPMVKGKQEQNVSS